MRPDGLELLRGVQALLSGRVLPQIGSPYLQVQVQMAIGMVGAALVELDDAPAAYAEERARVGALARQALALRPDPEAVPLAELQALAGETASGAARLSEQSAGSARLLGLLDRLLAWCEEMDGDGPRVVDGEQAERAALAATIRAELALQAGRRATWAVQR
jgi:hypothetical protein